MSDDRTGPHLAIDHVEKRFRTARRTELTALQDVSISVPQGAFVSIVGPSGCGKSTLLYIISGLLPATSGSVLVNGEAVTSPSPDRGLVLQNSSIFPWRRVGDNVGYGLEMKGVPRDERRRLARHYLGLVGLQDFENYYPRELSGGMRQRVAIAQMLACSPSIYLMDEPFGALDAMTREILQEQLLQLWEQDRKTVIFVTHSIDEAIVLSDRIVVMSARPGRIQEVLDVDLPRPRTSEAIRGLPEFARLRSQIWSMIKTDRRAFT